MQKYDISNQLLYEMIKKIDQKIDGMSSRFSNIESAITRHDEQIKHLRESRRDFWTRLIGVSAIIVSIFAALISIYLKE